MTKYIASCGSVTGSAAYSATGTVIIILKDISAAQITVAAVDSRGNQTSVSKTAEVIPYAPPVIRSLTARRVNGSTAEVVLDLAASIYADPIGATANAVQSLSYTYTPDGGETSEAIQLTPTVSGGTVRFQASVQGDLGTGGFAVKNSYTITVTLTDKLSGTSLSVPLNSGIVILDLYRSGETYGVGIGALYDPAVSARLQIDGDAVADYPIEIGESGDWTYIKYASGLVDLNGKKRLYSFNSLTQSGGIYYGDCGGWTYPFALTEILSISFGFICTYNNVWYWGSVIGLTGIGGSYCGRGNSVKVEGYPTVRILGRYK